MLLLFCINSELSWAELSWLNHLFVGQISNNLQKRTQLIKIFRTRNKRKCIVSSVWYAVVDIIVGAIAGAAAGGGDVGSGGGHQIYFYFTFSNITHYYVNIFVLFESTFILFIFSSYSSFSFERVTLKCSVHL